MFGNTLEKTRVGKGGGRIATAAKRGGRRCACLTTWKTKEGIGNHAGAGWLKEKKRSHKKKAAKMKVKGCLTAIHKVDKGGLIILHE